MHRLLVELGTEDLPPKSLAALGRAFADALQAQLADAGLIDSAAVARPLWSPRRLAVCIGGVRARQPDRHETRKGPALKAAFDTNGKPTRAAEGFAKSNGVPVDALQRLETDDGAWLVFERDVPGQPATALIPSLVDAALAALPIARRMRWGAGDAQFVRPVHWLVLLLDDVVVDGGVMGRVADRYTYGHRFLAPQPIALSGAADYPGRLEAEGKVRVNAPDDRLNLAIAEMVHQAARHAGGRARLDDALVAEVAALVEWPVPLTGSFDRRFLALPSEVIESVLQLHQRYFPVYDADGSLLPHFVAITNLDSRNPELVKKGNERVILPRLTDAEFFFEQDRRRPLAARTEALAAVTFQAKLGSLADKTARVADLAATIAPAFGAEPAIARRAAELCKCDLLTRMVGEFPELQGTMGGHYARHDGEPDAVATAIGEHYLPRFASDAVPATPAGRTLAVADRLDTLVGAFAAGARPTGDKDPFALRRAALGVLRTLIDGDVPLELREAVAAAAAGLPDALHDRALTEDVVAFIIERLRALLADRGTAADVFEAVLAVNPARPVDFVARAQAVDAFAALEDAEALAAANKRIANILRQAGDTHGARVDDTLLADAAERALWDALREREAIVRPLLAARDYTAALRELAALRGVVDAFFEGVMVMADDARLRGNRIALLGEVLALFRRVADVGQLQR